ncbi:MAG: tRNA uridine-5-carboxymethylaminomethyl(34) synthesis GTPase MnmE [Ignavibacteriales bacterium]|nr:tRNA uridine-5-carboxymethylaminomethyl(34) synthesis GTPase MnmE [Ignavibacteriales bacterium]
MVVKRSPVLYISFPLVIMIKSTADTIAAIATPIGEGGIAIIRVSGKEALSVADRMFEGKHPLSVAASHTVHYGRIVGLNREYVDEVLCTVFRAPRSYTGEDVVEISCHGGLVITNRVLHQALCTGARSAEPGEFTLRAFLNGKLDLAQAEAVADLIHARSEKAREMSLHQLEGGLSQIVRRIRTALLETLGLLELELDFVEDGYEFVDRGKAIALINSVITDIDGLLSTKQEGRVLREGVRVVIAGAPNVGKSSLLNALLNEERAIVADVPGTTRDVIEDSINIHGALFQIADTAGIRASSDAVEQEGVRRTRLKIENADIVLLVSEAMRPVKNGSDPLLDGKNIIRVLNKADLAGDVPAIHGVNSAECRVSAKTGEGLAELREKMFSTALPNIGSQDTSGLVTNSRHIEALERSRNHLLFAREGLNNSKSADLVSMDLMAGTKALAEIVGEVTSEEMLNSIFANFCVGK